MADLERTAEHLLQIGFVDIAHWMLPEGDNDRIVYERDGENAKANKVLLENRNALYAFVKGDQVMYIGKTARTIEKRFVGYCRPGNTNSTNRRCHDNIRSAISNGEEIRIFVFNSPSHFQYGNFEINLAAGLEDDLILKFAPCWNFGDRKQLVSEDVEREEAEAANAETVGTVAETDITSDTEAPSQDPVSFSIALHPTYYRFGYLNPGINASLHLGNDNEPIRVLLGDDRNVVVSNINRTANANGSVRIVGGNSQIAQWFQKRFKQGDIVQGWVIDPHTIYLSLPG